MTIHQNWQYRLLALLLALFAWYLISGRERVETWVEMPIELVNLPEELVIREGMINRIEVRVRGPKSLVRALNAKDLAYTMDMGNLSEGRQTLAFYPQNVPVSNALQVMEIQPSRLEIVADRLITKVVPVKLRWEAQIDPDFQCVDRGITPAQVELEGARTLLQPVDQVQTKKLSLQIDEKRQWRGSVGLDISPEIEVRPATVEISLRFAPKTTNLWVRSRVTARPSPENGVSIEPESVRLHLELPLPLLEKEEWRKEIKVFVSIEDLEPGVYQRGYHVDLPKDTRILELKPSQLRVVLDTPADNEGKEAGPES